MLRGSELSRRTFTVVECVLLRVLYRGFYPRDALHSAVFAIVRVCLSVLRPSHAGIVLCQNGENYMKTFFDHHSTFLTPCADTKFQGNPFSGDVKYTEVGKFCDFRLNTVYLGNSTR